MTDGQDHVLSQADALTKKKKGMWQCVSVPDAASS